MTDTTDLANASEKRAMSLLKAADIVDVVHIRVHKISLSEKIRRVCGSRWFIRQNDYGWDRTAVNEEPADFDKHHYLGLCAKAEPEMLDHLVRRVNWSRYTVPSGTAATTLRLVDVLRAFDDVLREESE